VVGNKFKAAAKRTQLGILAEVLADVFFGGDFKSGWDYASFWHFSSPQTLY
jgi:hypothetical protein